MDRTDTLLLLCDFRVSKKPDAQAIEKIRNVARKLDERPDSYTMLSDDGKRFYRYDIPGSLLDKMSDSNAMICVRLIFNFGFGLMSFVNQHGLVVKYMNDDILTYRMDEFEEFLSAIAPFSEGFMQFCVDGERIVRYEAEDGVIKCLETPSYNSWTERTIF